MRRHKSIHTGEKSNASNHLEKSHTKPDETEMTISEYLELRKRVHDRQAQGKMGTVSTDGHIARTMKDSHGADFSHEMSSKEMCANNVPFTCTQVKVKEEVCEKDIHDGSHNPVALHEDAGNSMSHVKRSSQGPLSKETHTSDFTVMSVKIKEEDKEEDSGEDWDYL